MTDRSRPDLDDDVVSALGKLSESLETVEQARGLLYGFHQLTGKADRLLQEAVEEFRATGNTELADSLERDLVGRNVIADRWTFQVVEEFDDSYWSTFRDWDRTVRDEVLDGRRHVYEAQMKERNRTHGRPGHEARPEQ